mmetsp:Transcript_5811/g.18299  ORF Transcript_5811/g.18299 Transcript_5811/m.18299 type:complete len:259 (-) Transcript_5811:1710-2486(-)
MFCGTVPAAVPAHSCSSMRYERSITSNRGHSWHTKAPIVRTVAGNHSRRRSRHRSNACKPTSVIHAAARRSHISRPSAPCAKRTDSSRGRSPAMGHAAPVPSSWALAAALASGSAPALGADGSLIVIALKRRETSSAALASSLSMVVADDAGGERTIHVRASLEPARNIAPSDNSGGGGGESTFPSCHSGHSTRCSAAHPVQNARPSAVKRVVGAKRTTRRFGQLQRASCPTLWMFGGNDTSSSAAHAMPKPSPIIAA